MANKRFINHENVRVHANGVACELERLFPGQAIATYPIPRGGIPAMYAVQSELHRLRSSTRLDVVPTPLLATVFIDDLVDSGMTHERYRGLNPKAKFFALFDKIHSPNEWLIFPWEETEEKSVDDVFIRLLQYIGEDPTRGGLKETPERMAKAWKFWTSGYDRDPVQLLKTFEDGSEGYNEMVHESGIPFYSQCEHHLTPFFGTVTFAYIPSERVVGLSKMNRLVDIFARRLQVQERMTVQIIDSFCDVFKPLGAGITVKARHLCIESRGVQHHGCITTTSSFRGAMFDKPEARAEFFSLTNGR
jgi:GTP cyclohydrolase I